jgi:hypothetical protein
MKLSSSVTPALETETPNAGTLIFYNYFPRKGLWSR